MDPICTVSHGCLDGNRIQACCSFLMKLEHANLVQ
jgi:hypothetical protein